ncbi:lipoprotein [Raoultella terrigena]|uniref:Lipoprotein n=1 Tax=Raoultella terrigena TaxID=577 RepID=A0A4U9CW25_RAOTE|nr:lipoprotein [Raoultella terrigena]
MNKLFLLVLATMALSACDNQSAPQAFTPEMASFSNEFEFDPLRGPVKDSARRCSMSMMKW